MPADESVRLSSSHTEMTELLMPDDTNFFERALGGAILHWMDICGAISAMRFANSGCVTASMDHVDFISPIRLGEVVVLQAYVFDSGETSIEVKVDVRAEEPRTGESRETTTSFLTFVAVDEEGTPRPVPDVRCESDAEQKHREAAFEKRFEQMQSLQERMDVDAQE